MMGSFLTRALVMVLGYAYPAYECYKTVELNRPEIEQLRFWCQYWILVALLTVFERVGDTFVSWLPMYSEAKLAFFVYLWYPKTRGTTYVYDTFFRPYIAKHETEIDRSLLELRTRAGDMVVLYWQKAAIYGQTRFFEILQYVASQSQSQSQSSRPRHVQNQTTSTDPACQPAASARQSVTSQQVQPLMHAPPGPTKSQQHQTTSTAPSRQPAAPARQPAASARQSVTSQQVQPLIHAPPSPTKSQQLQERTETGAPTPEAPVAQLQTSLNSSPPNSEPTGHAVATEGAMQVDTANVPANEDSDPPLLETPMEEAIRMTHGRLRKRATTGGPPSH